MSTYSMNDLDHFIYSGDVVEFGSCRVRVCNDVNAEWAYADMPGVIVYHADYREFVGADLDNAELDDRLASATASAYAYGPDDPTDAASKALEREGYHVGSCGVYLVAVHGTDDGLKCAIEALEAYLAGEAYMLECDVPHAWHDAAGETLVTWDFVDSIGSIYDVFTVGDVVELASCYFSQVDAAAVA